MQPDSPPVKARAAPELGAPMLSLHASTVPPRSSGQAEAAVGQAEGLEQSKKQQQEPQAEMPQREATGGLEVPEAEGSQPNALRLQSGTEPPQVG